MPDFDTAGYGFEKTFYGGIYPASAYSANDSTLVPGMHFMGLSETREQLGDTTQRLQ